MSVTRRFNSLLLSFFVAAGASAAAAPASANGLNVLLTNDDGYDSDGIETMRAALLAAGHTVYLSAPATEQSGKSGSITADFGAIIGYTDHSDADGSVWAVEGTPADSVSAGLFGLTPAALPPGEEIEIVVSGVNDGENISRFSNASGTVGAAMWALRRGIPSIAVSAGQDITGLAALSGCFQGEPDPTGCDCNFGCIFQQVGMNAAIAAQRAAALTVAIIDELEEEGIPEGLGLNVNVPSGRFTPMGVQLTRSDNDQAFDLVIAENDGGELEVDSLTVNPYLAGLMVSQIPVQACASLPLDLDSEGVAFACAYNTIAIFNGNFDSSQDVTEQSKDLACALVPLAELPTFWDEPNNRNGNKNICKHR